MQYYTNVYYIYKFLDKLIEILMTRGENGYKKFLEILEYQYPHVYQDVTKKEPRDPPPGECLLLSLVCT